MPMAVGTDSSINLAPRIEGADRKKEDEMDEGFLIWEAEAWSLMLGHGAHKEKIERIWSFKDCVHTIHLDNKVFFVIKDAPKIWFHHQTVT